LNNLAAVLGNCQIDWISAHGRKKRLAAQLNVGVIVKWG